MAEISTLNGYKLKDKKAIRYYDTVADMVADTTLKNGMRVKTKGYYNIKDGGSGDYHITSSQSNSDYQEILNNNLYATLIVDDFVKPEQLGAYGDNTHDDTNKIQTALNNYNNVLMSKTYNFTEIEIKNNLVATGILNGDIKISKSDISFDFNIVNGEIKIVGDNELIQFVNIKGKRLTNEEGIGLHLVSHTNYGIQYCQFSIGLIRANECIKLNSSNGGWINQNYFYKTNVSYGTGITSVNLTGNNTYNGNEFNEIGFEDITKWFNIFSFSEALFQNCRMIPQEADNQGITIRELGIITNSLNITFDNKSHGTYYEFITYTNSRAIRIIGKAMRNEGVSDASYMKIKTDGIIDFIDFDTPIYKQNMSELTGTTIIEIYNYNVSKPIIFNYDTSKYTYVNLRIPDKIANALKYVDIVIIGTMGNSMTVTRNNNLLKEIPSGTENTTIRIYL